MPAEDNEAATKGKGQVISIDDFDLIRVIGRGSYAKVLMVELKKTRRIYAMKVIKKEQVLKTSEPHYSIRERRILASIDFPFIVGERSVRRSVGQLTTKLRRSFRGRTTTRLWTGGLLASWHTRSVSPQKFLLNSQVPLY